MARMPHATITQARQSLAVAELNVEKAYQDLLKQAADAYWKWVAAGRLREVALRLLALAQDRMGQVRLAVEEGENVLAGDLYNSGSSIVTVADLSEMEAHVLVDETEVVKL